MVFDGISDFAAMETVLNTSLLPWKLC